MEGTQETETLLVKKPEDGEVLDLVDMERVYPRTRSGECKAPPGHKCPFRQYGTSLPRAQVGMLPAKGRKLNDYDPSV